MTRAEPACAPDGQLLLDGLSTPEDDIARIAELASAVAPSPRLMRGGGPRGEAVCADVAFPWPLFARFSPADAAAPSHYMRALPVRLSSTFSSTYPVGENDGLLWSGRGVSQLLSAGAVVRWGALSLAVAPEVAWSENRAFDLVPNGRAGELRFGNPYYGDSIDLPQRFGTGPFATFGPGQSYIRLDRWNAAVGLSS